MENADIAKIFSDIADILEIREENPFRIRAYRNGALTLENLSERLAKIVERDPKQLRELPGIGEDLAAKIVEAVTTGKISFYEKLLTQIPRTLLDLMRIQGIGPRKARLFYKKLKVESIEDLEEAAKAGKLQNLPGMGKKSERKILQAIADFRGRDSKRFSLFRVLPHVEALVDYLKNGFKGIEVTPSGSVRRRKETIGDIDILVAGGNASKIMGHFVQYREVKNVLAKGETKSSIVLNNGLQVDVRVIGKGSHGSALHYFTGSKEHNVAIRDRAKRMGLKISEYGVFREKTGKRVGGKTEAEVFKAVGLSWIPPEMRENRGEIELAEKGELPKLIELSDMQGDLHMHTQASDGSHSIEEMALAAKKAGRKYVAITDHSKAVTVAHGLDEKQMLQHMKEIDKVNEKIDGIEVLKGVEVDILKEGLLDLEDAVLEKMDVVVGSIHSHFGMEEKAMTKRILQAIETGFVDIVGHPTGRLLGERSAYAVDMEKLMDAARSNHVALELNAYPNRLDLSDIYCKMARDKGVWLVISTDSHSTAQLENMIYGIYTARRGWLEKEHVLNTRPCAEFKKILHR
ncbi:MAG: DNA polymerase/3'-5' exonuclease PolX [Deltaproteobacteria bacterium]|nr:DNA polymerase/3'-5' exonuclease PolX [Deltaproteobacteria bacterium]